ncbi:MAG TPA: inorganic diphosphatase [Gammaproteobacteria bacterium]|nr:inorganic diphosphatase [Gammaproteobacteria bacterium]
MNLDRVGPGRNPPDEVNVIIEIPIHSDPVKYELDKETGALFVDRYLNTSMVYPCNYGYIPRTLAADGDPVDVLLATPMPIIHGAVIRCRPIGVLDMVDEAGDDGKVLAIPIDKVSRFHHRINSSQDLQPALLEQITHFFEHYKDLEPNKWVRVNGWRDQQAAREEINASLKRYEACPDKPHF